MTELLVWAFGLVIVFFVIPLGIKLLWNHYTSDKRKKELPNELSKARKQDSLAVRVARNQALLEAKRDQAVKDAEAEKAAKESAFPCICDFDEDDCDAHMSRDCEHDCA